MPVHHLADMTWEEVRDIDRARAVAILPVGAVEAHGPHLPLGTDVLIAEAAARACAERLGARGHTVLVLPPLWYGAAPFARDFPGTVHVDGAAVSALVSDVACSLAGYGVRVLALANAHLDPAHLRALREAAERTSGPAEGAAARAGEAAEPADAVVERADAADAAAEAAEPADAAAERPDAAAEPADRAARVVFVDLTRRAAADRLTEEFRTGACHAGRFEGSVILAERPDLYRAEVAAALQPNPASLSVAIREGKRTFEEAGGPRAYFGWPAEASADEGRRTVQVLGDLLAEAVLEAVERGT